MPASSWASGEFALIDAFLKQFGLDRSGRPREASAASIRKSGVLIGPGDDCAQLVPQSGAPAGMKLLATTDAALDGVHFELARCSPEDAGWKALAMNLSDLAAAGARPRWFLCALGVPESDPNKAIEIARGIARGMVRLAKPSGCALVGGNVTKADQWSITITALGEAKHPLSRKGARPGDQLILVGGLGEAALGLELIRGKRRNVALGAGERVSIAAQLRPVPQLEAGLIAAKFASAAIDISDGLLQDLGHLCRRSECGAELDCTALPRSRSVRAREALGASRGDHPYALSLSGGEEYALLLTVPRARIRQLLRQFDRADISAHLIGRMTGKRSGARKPSIRLLEGDRAIPLPARLGHDHLAK